jgi:diguanylate cyclase (GGDEF)-like protein
MPSKDHKFHIQVLDTLPVHIAVVNTLGVVVHVNNKWLGSDCFSMIQGKHFDWIGSSFIESYVLLADTQGDCYHTISGLEGVITGASDEFDSEYHCIKNSGSVWFVVHAEAMAYNEERYVIISHQEITKRKLAEQEVVRMSRTDSLTKVYNRGFFEGELDREWRFAEIEHSTLCLAILDVDNFKNINDAHGHIFGDKCLVKLGALLSDFFSESQEMVVGRYGGEEFCILSKLSLERFLKLYECFALALADLEVYDEKTGERVPLTLSSGIVEASPYVHRSISLCLDVADSLLYEAKRQGKNRWYSQKLSTIAGQHPQQNSGVAYPSA